MARWGQILVRDFQRNEPKGEYNWKPRRLIHVEKGSEFPIVYFNHRSFICKFELAKVNVQNIIRPCLLSTHPNSHHGLGGPHGLLNTTLQLAGYISCPTALACQLVCQYRYTGSKSHKPPHQSFHVMHHKVCVWYISCILHLAGQNFQHYIDLFELGM